MARKKRERFYPYKQTIKASTLKRIRDENRKLRKLIFKELNLLDDDLNVALEMLSSKKRKLYRSILTGEYAEKIYEKIIKAQILYYFFEGETRTNISEIYIKTPKEVTDIIEEFGFSRKEQFYPNGKARFVVGTKVFKSAKKAQEFKKETKSPYKIITISEREVILYDYLEKNQILIEDIAPNVLEIIKH